MTRNAGGSGTPSRHLSVVVRRPPEEVYAYAAEPAHLPRWAAGLSTGIEQVDELTWAAVSPAGRALVVFTPPNELGVLDHVVTLPDGSTTYNPLRVVPHPDGSEVVFTLRRAPSADDAALEADAALVQADLDRLRALLEAR